MRMRLPLILIAVFVALVLLSGPLTSADTSYAATAAATIPFKPRTATQAATLPDGSLIMNAADTEVAGLFNAFREQNGLDALTIKQHLMYIAASRLFLRMLPGIDFDATRIDAKSMPSGYRWNESWGFEIPSRLGTAQTAVDLLTASDAVRAILLSDEWNDIGAAYACDTKRCAVIVVFGVVNTSRP